MPSVCIGDERSVGRVVSISNFKVGVLLDPETRSQVRSYPHNIAIITQIGGYLLFPVSPGVFAVGIIVGASEDEAFEADAHGVMTLQLARFRRVVRLNLLGQLKLDHPFLPGVSQYPTLDTPALLPTDDELTAILRFEPAKSEVGKDVPLSIGQSPIYGRQSVMASYNDLLARPLGVVGNTGSGKSCSVARIIQEALGRPDTDPQALNAKFIILDINGEYAKAFGVEQSAEREVNAVYANGRQFHLPLWTFNLNEFVAFFEAAQASQVPVLERVITEIREDASDVGATTKNCRRLVEHLDSCLNHLEAAAGLLHTPEKYMSGENLKHLVEHLISGLEAVRSLPVADFIFPTSILTVAGLEQAIKQVPEKRIPPASVKAIDALLRPLKDDLATVRAVAISKGQLRELTADSPIAFPAKLLLIDEFFIRAVARFRGQERIQEYLATLRLRISRQLSDKRWSVFTKSGSTDIGAVVGEMISGSAQVSVVDCSMLAHDVLPCFCAVFGRILLDLRTGSQPAGRTIQPYVLVLEEAHNYLRPTRQDELWGIKLARDAFERISKEGRKFGLSLMIASQRPSDVSATVLSQCANFLIHRIQNPEDIDYFKKILPLGSRDLLDQLPILAPGEGLLMGSAVNVPTRIRVRRPEPSPDSETSRPWVAWQAGAPTFDVESVLRGLSTEAIVPVPVSPPLPQPSAKATSGPFVEISDDDVPF